MIFSLVSQSLSASERGDVVILFDQSQSMNSYNSRFISELVILTFINTFELTNHIVLVGFSENVLEHIRIDTAQLPDRNVLRKQIEEIKLTGKVTDYDPPLVYLENYKNDIALTIIVTDGLSDIWDKKLKYLSHSILADSRYDDLNQQYQRLKDNGVGDNLLYEKLSPAYEERNIQLINDALKRLKNKHSEQTIFLDISGKEQFLKHWTSQIEAGLVTLNVSSNDPAAIEKELHIVLAELQQRASTLLNEVLPENSDSKIEVSLESEPAEKIEEVETILETIEAEIISEKKEAEIITETIEPELIIETEEPELIIETEEPELIIETEEPELIIETIEAKIIPEQDLSTSIIEKPASESASYLKWLLLALFFLFLFLLIFYRKNRKPQIENLETEPILVPSEEEKPKYNFNRRIELRIDVPMGIMDVIWHNKDGKEESASVINISMHGLLFEKEGVMQDSIEMVRLNQPHDLLQIKTSNISKRANNRFYVSLDEFQDPFETRMRWIEILTRIENQSL